MTTKLLAGLLSFLLMAGSSFASDSVLLNGTTANPSNSATNYGCPYGFTSGTWGGTETTRAITCSSSGTFSNFRVNLLTAPGAGNSYTFNIKKNFGVTDITVPISGTATTGSDLVNTVAVVAGDVIAIEAIPASTPTQPSGFRSSLKFTSTTAGESMLFANSVNTLLTTVTKYLSFGGSIPGGTTTETLARIVIPTDGTIKNLVVNLNVAPGGVTSRTFTVYQNETITLLTVTIVGAATQASDLGITTLDVAPGDRISVECTATASAADSHAFIGVTFLADTPGEFIIAASNSETFSNSSTEYMEATAGNAGDTTTEANHQCLTDALTISKMYVQLSDSPGAGNDYTLDLRQTASSPGLQVVVSDAETADNASASISISAGDLLCTQIVPNSTPTARTGMISYLATIAETSARRVILMSENESDHENG